jgi:hypothetical protein
MTAYHLRFRHLDAAVLTATAALLEARTSKLPAGQAQAEFQLWADTAAAAYNLPRVTVEVVGATDGDGFGYGYVRLYSDGYGYLPKATLWLPGYHVIALLEAFRRHMQHHGIRQSGTPDTDARGWALSLYYQVRPRKLARLVSAGKIPCMTAADLAAPDPVGRIAHLTPADLAAPASAPVGVGYEV